MPNWCANAVVITATTPKNTVKLRDLKKRLDEGGTLFEFFMPYDPEKGSPWGTKWDVVPDSVYLDDDSMTLYFDSAWSPPINFYEELHNNEEYDINATFVEQGINYIGYYVNGDYKEDDFVPEDFDYEDDNSYENMLEIIEKYFNESDFDHPVTPAHVGG